MSTLRSGAVEKPLDASQLPLPRMTIDDGGAKIKFVVDNIQYEYDLQGEKLVKLGTAPPAAPGFGGRGGRGGRGNFQRQFQDQQQQQQLQQQQQRDGQQQQVQRGQRGGGQRGSQGGGRGRVQDYRVFSPDRKSYV